MGLDLGGRVMARRNANQRYHDRVANRYEEIYDDAYWQWHDGLTWDYLKPYLPTDMGRPVVDLGCGTGKWGRKLLKSGYRVTFVDLSAKMLDEARYEVERMGGLEKAVFLQSDLEDLSALPTGSFALALAMGEPVGCTRNPALALREIQKTLGPAGVLVATFDHRLAGMDFYLEKRQVDELERFLKTGRTHWLTRRQTEQFEVHTFEVESLDRLFAEAGFEILQTVGKTVLPMRKYRDWLEDPETRRRLARLERHLSHKPAAWGRCAHLQVAARKISPGAAL